MPSHFSWKSKLSLWKVYEGDACVSRDACYKFSSLKHLKSSPRKKHLKSSPRKHLFSFCYVQMLSDWYNAVHYMFTVTLHYMLKTGSSVTSQVFSLRGWLYRGSKGRVHTKTSILSFSLSWGPPRCFQGNKGTKPFLLLRNKEYFQIAFSEQGICCDILGNNRTLIFSHFLATDTFRARKATFSASVSKSGEVYTSETSCIKRTSVLIKNTLARAMKRNLHSAATVCFWRRLELSERLSNNASERSWD